MRPLIAFILLCAGFAVRAATIEGKVVNVADGDTITILDATKAQHKIRINGIDAPEKRQPFGTRSKQNMERLVARKEVTADCHKIDRYKRQICKVWVQPASNVLLHVGQFVGCIYILQICRL